MEGSSCEILDLLNELLFDRFIHIICYYCTMFEYIHFFLGFNSELITLQLLYLSYPNTNKCYIVDLFANIKGCESASSLPFLRFKHIENVQRVQDDLPVKILVEFIS